MLAAKHPVNEDQRAVRRGQMAKGTIRHIIARSEPRIRRGYFECRYGQLHVHNAIPPGGGFDEGTPLIALHHSPQSGATFERFLPFMGRDRSVYAPDLPGCGDSDPPPSRPSIADYAGAVADFCDAMRFRQIDVAGYHTGSFIAAELALARPDRVRRIVCVGLPIASDAEREAFRRAPWPARASDDGSFLAVEWERTRSHHAGFAAEWLVRSFAEKIRSGPRAGWGIQAAFEYPARERLGRVQQPLRVLRPRDAWWDATARVRDLVPRARVGDLADIGEEAFETAPERMAAALRELLPALGHGESRTG
jgi:pimeloyl-ACP methyl ester carboxylesterase